MVAAKGNKYTLKYDDKTLDKLIADLLYWAKNSEDIHLGSYAWKRVKKHNSWMNRMCEDHPRFKEAYETARALLANKVVNSSFYRKDVNAYVGMKYLGVYDLDYKDYVKWKAEIQKEIPQKEESKQGFQKFDEIEQKNYDSSNPKQTTK